MSEYFCQYLDSWLGLQADKLSVGQMCLRAAVVYLIALLMVRIVGNRRFAGKYAAVDIILSITLGATLSQAIVNASTFLPILCAALVLVSMHWLMAALSFRIPVVEQWVKGTPQRLVQDGQINARILKNASITQKDLDMVIRSQGSLRELEQVALAILEPSGDISVISKSTEESSPPAPAVSERIVDIDVAENVETVRLLIRLG